MLAKRQGFDMVKAGLIFYEIISIYFMPKKIKKTQKIENKIKVQKMKKQPKVKNEIFGQEEFNLVRLLALLEEPFMKSPVVVLHDPIQNKVLPIWVGEPESRAIAMAYQGVELSRPLTHDLLAHTLSALGGKVWTVYITGLEAGTYFAEIEIKVRGKKNMLVMDSRPSDAIALALLMGAPIYVSQSIMDRAGQNNPFPEGMNPVESLEKEGKERRFKQEKAQKSFSEDELEKIHELLDQARTREFGEEEEGGKKHNQ